MFCNNCGKSIPDESAYCLFCGSKIIGGKRKEQIEVNFPPPEYVGSAFIKAIGPVKERAGKGFFSNGQVGRWINFGFTLCDKAGKHTRSNGSAILAINPWGKLGKLTSEKIHALKMEATFFGEFEIFTDDFDLGIMRVDLTYSSDFVYFENNETYLARIGFRTPDGRILEYGDGFKTLLNEMFTRAEVNFY